MDLAAGGKWPVVHVKSLTILVWLQYPNKYTRINTLRVLPPLCRSRYTDIHSAFHNAHDIFTFSALKTHYFHSAHSVTYETFSSTALMTHSFSQHSQCWSWHIHICRAHKIFPSFLGLINYHMAHDTFTSTWTTISLTTDSLPEHCSAVLTTNFLPQCSTTALCANSKAPDLTSKMLMIKLYNRSFK